MLEGTCHCGAVRWEFDAEIDGVTACNCTICRRYGALWICGHEGEDVRLFGPTSVYEHGPRHIGYHFCTTCGCVMAWRVNGIGQDSGRRRMAVNLRMTDPDPVQDLPIDHFEGLVSFEDLPRDGRCVRDMWF